MTTDLFEFWSEVGPSDRVHPADHDVLSRVKNHKFNLGCLPYCFMGPLKTAKIVLLYLSPGFNKRDLKEATSEIGQERCMEMRTGNQPLPGPDDYEPAWKWWVSRSRCFGSWEKLRNEVAVLNIGGYHSTSFGDYQLLAALPSCRISLDWAQSVLFPQAIDRQRIVICLRAGRFWGLREGHKVGSLYAPVVTRGGHMRHGKMRNVIVRDVRRRLELAPHD